MINTIYRLKGSIGSDEVQIEFELIDDVLSITTFNEQLQCDFNLTKQELDSLIFFLEQVKTHLK